MKNSDDNTEKAKKPDSCGCATGARVMTAAFIISAVYFGWQFHQNAIGLTALILRTLMITFLGAGAGKIAGLIIYRLRKPISVN